MLSQSSVVASYWFGSREEEENKTQQSLLPCTYNKPLASAAAAADNTNGEEDEEEEDMMRSVVLLDLLYIGSWLLLLGYLLYLSFFFFFGKQIPASDTRWHLLALFISSIINILCLIPLKMVVEKQQPDLPLPLSFNHEGKKDAEEEPLRFKVAEILCKCLFILNWLLLLGSPCSTMFLGFSEEKKIVEQSSTASS